MVATRCRQFLRRAAIGADEGQADLLYHPTRAEVVPIGRCYDAAEPRLGETLAEQRVRPLGRVALAPDRPSQPLTKLGLSGRGVGLWS